DLSSRALLDSGWVEGRLARADWRARSIRVLHEGKAMPATDVGERKLGFVAFVIRPYSDPHSGGPSRKDRSGGRGGMGGLDGKVAIGTGGATLIGARVARKLSGFGVKTLIADIDEAGEAAARDAGNGARFRRTDLRQDAEIEACVRAACDAFG